MTIVPEVGHQQRVLVTGGGGFLGAAIVRLLVNRGDTVTSYSRRRHNKLEHLGVRQIRGDLGDAASLTAACRGMQVVYHTAAKAAVWGSAQDYYRTNVTGTENVIAACRTAGVPCLIHTSSPSVVFDGRPMEGVDESVPYPAVYHAAYPRTKALAEQRVVAAADERLATLVLRPHLIWGPQDPHLVPRIIDRAAKLRIVGRGDNRVDTIYIDNAAAAHVMAADRLSGMPTLSGRIYFISNDEPIPLWQMIDAILQAAGLPPVRRRIHPAAAYAVGAVLETAYRLLRLQGEPRMTRFVARELATAHWFDISAAKRDLGYAPSVSVAEGLKRLKRWLDSRKERELR